MILGAGTGLGVAALAHGRRAVEDHFRRRRSHGLRTGRPRAGTPLAVAGRPRRAGDGRARFERRGVGRSLPIRVRRSETRRTRTKHRSLPPWVQIRLPRLPPAGSDAPESRCGHALRLFCAVYGAFAGDLALLFDARGGVFLAGGIAPKILAVLRGTQFIAAFRDKGVHSRLAANYAVQVVMEPRVGLLGALQLAGGRGIA